MKVTMTLIEAQTLITSLLRLPDDSLVEIEGIKVIEPNDTRMNTVQAINTVTHVEFPVSYRSNNKIAAIKRFRELTGCGLAEAKYAIEQPEKAIEFYCRHGSLKPCGY